MKKYLFSIILSVLSVTAFADEGMWLPQLLEALNAKEMKKMGMKINASDIYSDMLKTGAIGGSTSFAMYHALNYYNFRRSSLRSAFKPNGVSEFKAYRNFAKAGGDFQRGLFRHKEFQGIVYKDGTMDRAPASSRLSHRTIPVSPDPSKEVALQYHTHRSKPYSFYYENDYIYQVQPGPTNDDYFNAFGPLSIVITRTEAYSYTNVFGSEILQPAYYITRYNTGSLFYR